jgi:hypothetical protein
MPITHSDIARLEQENRNLEWLQEDEFSAAKEFSAKSIRNPTTRAAIEFLIATS